MQENVLITITANASDIDPAISKFRLLTAEEKKLAAEAQKAEVIVKKQGQTTKQTGEQGSKSIASLAKQFGEMDKVIANGAVITSLRSAIKELTQEMALLELQGKQDTEEFKNLRAVAGELADTMDAVRGRIKDAASDTNQLDGVIAMAESVAAGFSLAQGAATLFGASSKDLEKALVPLQASMAVLMGLTQLQNAVQKESIQMRVIETFQTRAGAAATRLDTAAKSTNIVVSKGATAAQWALNLAQSMSPVMLLVTGVGLLVGVLAAFVLMGESAAEKQEKLNNQMQAGLDITKRTAEHLSNLYADIDKYLDRQITLYNAQGKSLEEIQRLEKARSEAAVDGAKEQIQANDQLIKSLQDNEDKINSINRALDSYAKGNKQARVSVEIDGKIMNYELDEEDEKKNLETLKGIFEEQVNIAKNAVEAKKDVENKAAVNAIEMAKKLNESRMRGTVAYYEAVAVKAKQGSYEEFKAQENGVKAKAALDIENIKNSTVSEKEKANQIFKINALLLRDLRSLRDSYQIEQINNQKAAIDAELVLIKEGSKEELDLKLRSIEKQRQADLIAAKDNGFKKMLIEANYQKEVKGLNEAYQKRLIDDSIAAEEAKSNILLARAEKGSQEELRLKKNLIDLQADAEVNSIAFSEKNEEVRRLKIQAVYAKALQDKKQLERDKANAEIEARLNNKNLDRDADRIATEKLLTQSLFFEFGKRADLEKRLHGQKLKAIDDERSAFDEKLSKGIIQQDEYNAKVKELNNSQAEIELDDLKNKEEAKSATIQASVDFVVGAMNAYYDAKKERLQQDLEDVKNNYTTDAQEAKTSSTKKLITAEEMRRKELDIKRQMAKADKEQALFNATINMAMGITKALSSAPPPYNAILAAITAAASMVQIKAISSKPLPKYWKGRKSGKGEFATVGEYGPETMWIPSGAAIIPHHKSRMVNEAMKVLGDYQIPYPSVQDVKVGKIPSELKERIVERNQPIDYERLADAIAGKMSNKEFHISMDKHGFSSYLLSGNSKTKIVNNKYKMTA